MRGSLSKLEYTIIFTSATDREGKRGSLPQAPSVRRLPKIAELESFKTQSIFVPL